MNQNYIPDLDFFKERAFESDERVIKIKSDRIFGRMYGDPEFIPLNFIVSINNSERIFVKEDIAHSEGQIIFTYIDSISLIKIFVYL